MPRVRGSKKQELPKLTDREERFCTEYVRSGKKVEAAILAGYSEKNAATYGSRLYSKAHIRERIGELRADVSDRNNLDTDKIINRISNIASFEINQIGSFDGTRMTFKDESEWTAAARTAVASVKQTTTTRTTKSGDVFETNIVEFKIEPKIPALALMAKFTGLDRDLNTSIECIRRFGLDIRQDVNGDLVATKVVVQ